MIKQTESNLMAGTGRCDITVKDDARLVADRLYAKVLVFDNGATRAAVITMDAVAIGGICDIEDSFLPKLRERVSKGLNIASNSILVNASHTHPPGRILCDEEELVERVYSAVRRAAENLVPVKVGSGSVHDETIAMNRNLKLVDGSHWTIRHANPSPPDEAVAAVNEIDTEIGVVRIDRMDGTPLAVIYNFGCHLLFGDTQGSITANFVGQASGLVEEMLGDEVLAFFLQGAAGDVIDMGFKDFSGTRSVEFFGMKLGLNVLRCAKNLVTEDVRLKVISKVVEFPKKQDFSDKIEKLEARQSELLGSLRYTSLNLKSFMRLYLEQSLDSRYPRNDRFQYLQAESIGDQRLIEMDRFNSENIKKYVSAVRAMEELARIQDEIETYQKHRAINDASGGSHVPAELQGLRIGDAVLISAPLEVLTRVGMNVKKSSPHQRTFIAAFSNGYMHYGPPADDYDKGGYEVIECFLGPDWQQIFEKNALEILQEI